MGRRALIALSLIAMTSWVLADADIASARARFGGSRGGRSHSAPARPSLPHLPAAPSRSLGEPHPAGTPAVPAAPAGPRPSFLGFAKGVGAAAVGGLVGRILFGIGGARPGFGLVEILLLGLAGYYAVGYLRGLKGRPRPTGLPKAPAPSGRRGPAPSFDAGQLTDAAAALYAGLQSGFVMQEMGMFRNRLTPGLYASLQARCDELRSARQSWHVDKIDVEHAEVAQAWTQDGHDYAEVRLVGSLCEYTADDAGGAIVAGSNQAPRSFDERWTFMRPSGSTPWRLAAIQAA